MRNYGRKKLNRRGHLENLGEDENIKKDLRGKEWEGVNWMILAQDTDQ
jgi:hypothetical protein